MTSKKYPYRFILKYLDTILSFSAKFDADLAMGRGGDSDTRKTQFGLDGAIIIPVNIKTKPFNTYLSCLLLPYQNLIR